MTAPHPRLSVVIVPPRPTWRFYLNPWREVLATWWLAFPQPGLVCRKTHTQCGPDIPLQLNRGHLNQAEETVEGNGSVWFGDSMRNARTGEWRKCAKSNGDPGAIRTRDPQLRRSMREILDSITDTYSYNTFQFRLVPAGDRLSRLEGGEHPPILAHPNDVGMSKKIQRLGIR